ncbi:hypothetical protein, partial [Klebsiella pneumoniae]|uniref:hypothetical protein n=1 Tax=Klebsiella pneumoniae TaxID=573 RepID=UPI003013FED0
MSHHHHPSDAAGIIFTGFSHGLQQEQHIIAQQIGRDKLSFQGLNPLVAIEEHQQESGGGLHGYQHETAGMLSEMFNFPSVA